MPFFQSAILAILAVCPDITLCAKEEMKIDLRLGHGKERGYLGPNYSDPDPDNKKRRV